MAGLIPEFAGIASPAGCGNGQQAKLREQGRR